MKGLELRCTAVGNHGASELSIPQVDDVWISLHQLLDQDRVQAFRSHMNCHDRLPALLDINRITH